MRAFEVAMPGAQGPLRSACAECWGTDGRGIGYLSAVRGRAARSTKAVDMSDDDHDQTARDQRASQTEGNAVITSDPTDTAHPTGSDEARANADNEPAA